MCLDEIMTETMQEIYNCEIKRRKKAEARVAELEAIIETLKSDDFMACRNALVGEPGTDPVQTHKRFIDKISGEISITPSYPLGTNGGVTDA